MNKTLVPPQDSSTRQWFLVDAENQTLGRLASEVASVLRGKNNPNFAPHIDAGDFVVVINAEKVVFTGKKWDQKKYTWYVGYPRQRSETARRRLQKRPEMILREAVRRMLPKNRLATQMLDKLKIYAGEKHPHQAQLPEPRDLGAK